MTDSQTLLEEYAQTGSESAFRELVTRYFGLVYGAALRLVGGDTHLAEDVAQIVFADLARKAGGLSRQVMLGGWLHRRTCNVAAPMMRAQRRRQAREREAAYMSTLSEDSGADLAQVAPILDEAITRLQTEDRTALILRFFERRDFRAIGVALGSSEDAARMRVNRALDKLHLLLRQRGATLSAAALAAALAGESVTAAPAGLAASVAGSALAASAGGGLAAALLKIGIMTKLKAGILTAAALAGVAASVVIQHQAQTRSREQDDARRRQSGQMAHLAADNERLSNLVARASAERNQLTDLLKLRAEADSLRRQTNDLAALRETQRQLQQRAVAGNGTLSQLTDEERIARMQSEKYWLMAFRMYAGDHQDQFPTNFEQAASFYRPNSNGPTGTAPAQFEIVYQGSAVMAEPGEVLVLREKQPWQDSAGKPCKAYGFADGHVQVVAMPSQWTVGGRRVSYDSFEAYEKDHIVTPPGQ